MKLILCSLLLIVLPLIGRAETFSFDNSKDGELPREWIGGVTGGGHAKWSVESDDSAPSKPHVLKQSGQGTFLWCVLKDLTFADGSGEVRFKPVSGKEDQAAEAVWRFQDGDNYYVCRANALENNVVLYKVVKGKRTALDIVGRKGGYGVKADVPSGWWSTLRVGFKGTQFAVALNGHRVFTVEDNTFTTKGRVGVWTKADSVTAFDDFWFGR